MSIRGSHVWLLGPQLAVGKVVGLTLQSKGLLEKGHCGQVLRLFDSMVLLPRHCAFWVQMQCGLLAFCQHPSLSCFHIFTALTDRIFPGSINIYSTEFQRVTELEAMMGHGGYLMTHWLWMEAYVRSLLVARNPENMALEGTWSCYPDFIQSCMALAIFYC